MQPRYYRARIQSKAWRLARKLPSIPEHYSAPKRTRLERDVRIAVEFLKGSTVIAMAEKYRCRHQWVSWMVSRGIAWLDQHGAFIKTALRKQKKAA